MSEKDLVEKTTSILKNAIKELESSLNVTSSGPSSSTINSSSAAGSSGVRASENFRRALPGLCSRNVVRNPVTSTSAVSAEPREPLNTGPATEPRSKKPKLHGYAPVRFTPLETWTHDICVLAMCDENSTPSRKRLEVLMKAGLGKMKLVFPNKNANHTEVQCFLEEKFPRLKNGGGIEILRAVGGGGGSRSLHLVPPGREGYPLPYIKERFSQAAVYIRPLQTDLDESPMSYKDTDSCHQDITCMVCGESLSYLEFKSHKKECQDRPVDEQTAIGKGSSPECRQESSVAEQIQRDHELAEQLQDDEDISLTDTLLTAGSATASSTSTLQESLEKIKTSIDASSKSRDIAFFVQRSRVWKNVFEELKNCELSTYKMSAEFIGESAVDTGGPTREMFSLVYKQVIDGKLTRGSFPNLTFSHDQGALMAGEYKALGQLIALAFLNKANTPHFFSPTVAHYMLGTHPNSDPVKLVDEIPDGHVEVKEKLKALLECENPTTWDEAIVKFEERFDMGINKVNIPLEEKEDFIQATNKHIMVSSVAEEIFSFQEGLSAFGVLDALKMYPEESVKQFIFAEVTVEDIMKSFVPDFSVSGSSRRQCEETIVFNFNQFLKQCERKNVQRKFIDIATLELEDVKEVEQILSLHDVLQFLSGASHLPPGSIQGSIQFIHGANKGQRVKANTCALEFAIPVNNRYFNEESSVFTANLADDIFDGQGYGCV